MPPPLKRSAIPLPAQVRVFFRDGWICHWCGRPTVFSPTFRLLANLVKQRGWARPLAYHHKNWRRDLAPLLDQNGAVIDHVEAHSTGGASAATNLVTACNKCNARKNSKAAADHLVNVPKVPIKGKYGEPKHWDGLASLFLVLTSEPKAELSPSERAWAAAFRVHLGIEAW